MEVHASGSREKRKCHKNQQLSRCRGNRTVISKNKLGRWADCQRQTEELLPNLLRVYDYLKESIDFAKSVLGVHFLSAAWLTMPQPTLLNKPWK